MGRTMIIIIIIILNKKQNFLLMEWKETNSQKLQTPQEMNTRK